MLTNPNLGNSFIRRFEVVFLKFSISNITALPNAKIEMFKYRIKIIVGAVQFFCGLRHAFYMLLRNIAESI